MGGVFEMHVGVPIPQVTQLRGWGAQTPADLSLMLATILKRSPPIPSLNAKTPWLLSFSMEISETDL